MAKALAAARSGFRRLFSISAFTPPPAAAPTPKADPSPNLFVSGLSKRTTSEGLREAFSKFGEIIQAKVVTDRVSGYSKGFGFVRYASTNDANEGIKGMDGKFLDGWVIFAEYARPRPPPSQDQSSQPQLNYGSAPQSNYSSPYSPSSYYTQPPSSSPNYSPRATQPPLTNSYYAPQTSQSQQSYDGSAPPSNYPSQMSPSPSNHESVQPQTDYSSNYFNHSPQTSPPSNASAPPSQTYRSSSNYESMQPQSGYSSNYFNHSPPATQPPHNSASMPPLNYSSEISQQTSKPSTTPSWYPYQTNQPASYMSEPPKYNQSHYGSAPTFNNSAQAPQQTYTYPPQTSDPTPPGYASTRNSETFEQSEVQQPDYEPGRAVNY